MRDYKLTPSAADEPALVPDLPADDDRPTVGPVSVRHLVVALSLLDNRTVWGDAGHAGDDDAQWAEGVLSRALGDSDNRGEMVDTLARWHVRAQAAAAGCRAEAAALKAAATAKETEAARREASGKWALELAASALKAAGLRDARGVEYRLAVQAVGGVLPLVVDDDAAVPVGYRKPVPPPPAPESMPVDKEAVRRDLAAGLPVPGCRLGERGEKVVVK